MGQRQRTARSEAVDRIPVGLAEFKATEPAFEPAVAEMSRPVPARTAISIPFGWPPSEGEADAALQEFRT
jgi:hypothetical protein